MLVEITDLEEIAAAQALLSRRLGKELPYDEERTIGYPSGHFQDDVSFAKNRGEDLTWWSGGLSRKKDKFVNYFGRGTPGSQAALSIDLQFNFPRRRFARNQGGAFVRDTETNQVLLAHRGIVTRGKSRVRKESLLSEVDVTVALVESGSGDGEVELLIVGPIDMKGISEEVRQFAIELRRAASEVAARGSDSGADRNRRRVTPQDNWHTILGDYFEEFSGERIMPKRGPITATWNHGKVVRALRQALAGRGSCHKSGLIDLALKSSGEIFVFEIKTSAGTTSVYTGIGQLYLHGLVVQRCFPKLKVHRYLVTPTNDLSERHRTLCGELGIRLASYEESGEGFKFTGL